MTLNLTLQDIDSAAKQFVDAIGDSKIIAFYGKMGAGKTTFIKALCQALGVQETVNSPTFAIVNEYRDASDQPIFHFDFYRLRRPEEAYDIGFEEYIDSGALCLMEWPEIIEPLLPEETLRVSIEEQPDGTRTMSW